MNVGNFMRKGWIYTNIDTVAPNTQMEPYVMKNKK